VVGVTVLRRVGDVTLFLITPSATVLWIPRAVDACTFWRGARLGIDGGVADC
jgi:hypothetical protein